MATEPQTLNEALTHEDAAVEWGFTPDEDGSLYVIVEAYPDGQHVLDMIHTISLYGYSVTIDEDALPAEVQLPEKESMVLRLHVM